MPHSAAEVREVERPTAAPPAAITDPLRHHGDVEAVGLLDFAVNVFPGPPPTWLSEALRDSLERVGTYPDAASASAAAAARHGRPPDQALATAGAAEAFSLVARLRSWRHAVVVHPQFTEPHAALQQAGHRVTGVLCTPDTGFALDPAAVPDDADLVMIGNPTNPTGVLHPAETIQALLRLGRTVVVDEAFMDTVPGEVASLASRALPGLLVLRSLTKHWGIPGVRAGYLLGDPATVARLRRAQVPWSVSTSAAAAIVACTAPAAKADTEERTQTLICWRNDLEAALRRLGIEHVPSSTSYVLARVGDGVHARLREAGIAVRRADTFPGLGPEWVRIAARPRPQTEQMVAALSHALG